MTLGRREFLWRLSVAIAALGIGDATFTGLCGTYQQALARPSRRLALLVGINQYSSALWQGTESSDKGTHLQGALTDIELQRELLVQRFGVPPADILSLVDSQATTQGILGAIQEHLVAQAQPGDTVVFHFSGIGSQVQLQGAATPEPIPTLVAADSRLPKGDSPIIRDLFEETLSQALGSLQGVRIVTILDASSTPHQPLIQGNFRVRSRATVPSGEWPVQPGSLFQEPRKSAEQLTATWPGLLLRASQPGMPALEGNWYGFSAGVFTYALTQQIWSSQPAQRQQWVLNRVERTMETWAGGDIALQVNGQLSMKDGDDLLFPRGVPRPAANGTIKTLDANNKSAVLWLGGLSDVLLPYSHLGLRLRPMPTLPGLAAIPEGTVTVKTITGLQADADVQDPASLAPGTPLVEVERRLPKEVTLTVALDPALERIERVDATSALSGLPYITTTAPGEQWADCLFGRLTPPVTAVNGAATNLAGAAGAATNPDAGRSLLGYGLFSPDHTLIPGTATEEEEAVKTAVGRLTAPLRNLLAVKLLRLTANPVSSRLPLRLTLETLNTANKLLLVEETLESRQFSSGGILTPTPSLPSTSVSNQSQKYRLGLFNLSQQPLYYLIISVVEKSRFSVYCPPLNQGEGPDQTTKMIAEASQLPPNRNLQFPRMEGSSFSLQPTNSAEIFAIACTHPFYGTWKALRTADFRQLSDRWATMPSPLPVAKAVLADLNQASLQTGTTASTGTDTTLALRSETWATLSLRSPIELA